MIKFNNLYIEGFGSISKPLHLPLHKKGVHLVRGKNGSGKTTMWSAFMWCLYGVNLKGVTSSKLATKPEYRLDDFQGTRVMIHLTSNDVDYLIARHIDYKNDTHGIKGKSSLLVFKSNNGEFQVIDAQHKADSQEFIQSLLRLDSSLFLSSILFGQRMKRFIEAGPADKRKLFESIFDLTAVDLAKVTADEKIKEQTDLINQIDSTILIHKNNIENKRLRISEIQKQLNTFESIRKQQIDYQQSILDNARLELSKLIILDEQEDISYDPVITSSDQLKLKLSSTSTKWELLKEPVAEDVNCSVCGNKLNNVQLEELNKKYELSLADYRKRKNQLSDEIRSLQVQIEEAIDHESEILAYKDHNEEQSRIRAANASTNKLKQSLESQIKSAEQQIVSINEQSLDVSVEDIDLLLSEIDSSELEIESNIDNKSDSEKLLEVLSWWSKIGFTSKGLKGYILNSALNELNKLIYKYSSRLGLNIIFSIDTIKASKPFITQCFNGEVELDYDEFSGGEKARIDVATAFAMHDLVSSTTEFNLLIMDEIFEGLDNDGIEDVFDLIRMKGEGKSLYVITHSEQIDSLNTKRIDVYKTDSTYIQ